MTQCIFTPTYAAFVNYKNLSKSIDIIVNARTLIVLEKEHSIYFKRTGVYRSTSVLKFISNRSISCTTELIRIL